MVNQSAAGIAITLPSVNHDPVVTLIRLDLNGSADGFNRDRSYHAGSQEQAEMILYGTAAHRLSRHHRSAGFSVNGMR